MIASKLQFFAKLFSKVLVWMTRTGMHISLNYSKTGNIHGVIQYGCMSQNEQYLAF